MTTAPTLLVLLALLSGCTAAGATSKNAQPALVKTQPRYRVVSVSDVVWEQLNAARGDKSPKAADLWGDRKASGATGYLLNTVDGFRSPPHVHNVSYRGVVISGLLHNDDPRLDPMWMPTTSFWTQPKGQVHITAARGNGTLAYIEIEEGPYLVRPVARAFDSAERPVNVHASNIVWVAASGYVRRASSTTKGPRVAFLWGDPHDEQPSGSFVKLPAGFSGSIRGHGSTLRAVVIEGRLAHRIPNSAHARRLLPGSYFSSTGPATHLLSIGKQSECVVYLRVEGTFAVTATSSTIR